MHCTQLHANICAYCVRAQTFPGRGLIQCCQALNILKILAPQNWAARDLKTYLASPVLFNTSAYHMMCPRKASALLDKSTFLCTRLAQMFSSSLQPHLNGSSLFGEECFENVCPCLTNAFSCVASGISGQHRINHP